MYSGGGAGFIPGQYVPQLLSSAFDAVVTYMFRSSGIIPSNTLPLSHASIYNTYTRHSIHPTSSRASFKWRSTDSYAITWLYIYLQYNREKLSSKISTCHLFIGTRSMFLFQNINEIFAVEVRHVRHPWNCKWILQSLAAFSKNKLRGHMKYTTQKTLHHENGTSQLTKHSWTTMIGIVYKYPVTGLTINNFSTPTFYGTFVTQDHSIKVLDSDLLTSVVLEQAATTINMYGISYINQEIVNVKICFC